MKYVKIIVVLLILSLLAGCKSDTIETDNMTYEKVTNVYKIIEFDLPGDFYYTSYFTGRDNHIYIYGFLDSEYITMDSFEVKVNKNYGQLKFNSDGELLETISIDELTGTMSGYSLAGLQSNGNYVFMGYNAIELVSAEGDTLNKFDFVNEWGIDLFISETDEIYMISGRTLYVFDSGLNLIAEIENADTLEKVMSDENGNIIVKSFTSGSVFKYDANTKTLTNYTAQYVNPYIFDKTGVYANGTQLLNWENSDILYSQTKKHKAINENVIICEMIDFFDVFYRPVLFERVPDDEVAPKAIVNLALTSEVDINIVNEAVALFNRENETYRIVTTDYTVYNAAPNFDQGEEKLLQDMIAGNSPDIVLINPFISLKKYTEKDVFADLTAYLENNDLLKCVENAYFGGGKIYHIPIFIQLNTMVTKSENVPFTLDKLYSLAENNSTLFSKYLDILEVAMYDFIDCENKTCDFENDEFLKLLEFQKNISDYVNTEKGAVNNFANNYFITSDKLHESLTNDELPFLQLPFNTIAGYIISKVCYDDDFVICGYPTNKGNASKLRTNYTFGITGKSKVKNGSWEFIEFLLSDTIQASETLMKLGLPVTSGGIEKTIDYYAEYFVRFDQTDGAFINESSGEVSINISGQTEILHENHPNKEFVDYVVKLTDKDKQKLLDFFNSATVKSHADSTISDIVNEEYDEYYENVISADEAAKRIQNRVFTYLNE